VGFIPQILQHCMKRNHVPWILYMAGSNSLQSLGVPVCVSILEPGKRNVVLLLWVYRQFSEISFCLSNSAFDRNAFDKMYDFSGRHSRVPGRFHNSVSHLVGDDAGQHEFWICFSNAHFCSMMSLYRCISCVLCFST